MPAPLLVLTATQNRRTGRLPVSRSFPGRPRLRSNTTPAGFSQTVQFLASGAVPGILEPGESVTVPVYYAGWLHPSGTSPGRRSLHARRAGHHEHPNHRLVLAQGRSAAGSINEAAWNAIIPDVDRQRSAPPGASTSRRSTTTPSTSPASASRPPTSASSCPSRSKRPTPPTPPRRSPASPPTTCPPPAWT